MIVPTPLSGGQACKLDPRVKSRSQPSCPRFDSNGVAKLRKPRERHRCPTIWTKSPIGRISLLSRDVVAPRGMKDRRRVDHRRRANPSGAGHPNLVSITCRGLSRVTPSPSRPLCGPHCHSFANPFASLILTLEFCIVLEQNQVQRRRASGVLSGRQPKDRRHANAKVPRWTATTPGRSLSN